MSADPDAEPQELASPASAWQRWAFGVAVAGLVAAVGAGVVRSFRFDGGPPRVSLDYDWHSRALDERGLRSEMEREVLDAATVYTEGRGRSLLSLAKMRIQANDPVQAEVYLWEVVQRRPGSFEARRLLAVVIAAQRRYAEGLAQLDDLIREFPESPQLRADRALVIEVRDDERAAAAGRQAPSH